MQRAAIALISRIYQLDVRVTAPSFTAAIARKPPQPNILKTFTVRVGTDEFRQRTGLDDERVAQHFTSFELLVHGDTQILLVPNTMGSLAGGSLLGHVGEGLFLGTYVLRLQDVGVETARAEPVTLLVHVENARGEVLLVGGERLQVAEGLLQAQAQLEHLLRRFRRGQLHLLAPERDDERFLEVPCADGLHVQVPEGALSATGIRVAVAVDLRRPSGQGGVAPVARSAPTSP